MSIVKIKAFAWTSWKWMVLHEYHEKLVVLHKYHGNMWYSPQMSWKYLDLDKHYTVCTLSNKILEFWFF